MKVKAMQPYCSVHFTVTIFFFIDAGYFGKRKASLTIHMKILNNQVLISFQLLYWNVQKMYIHGHIVI